MGFSPNITVFTFTALFAVLGITAWLLFRKYRKQMILPTLKVISLNASKKPKLTFKLPPIVPYFCFSVLALVFAAMASKPFQKVFLNNDDSKEKVLYVVDLSPSVEAIIDLEGIRERLKEEIEGLIDGSDVSIISSSQLEVSKIESLEFLLNYLNNMSIHREGFKISSLFEHLGQELDLFEKVIVFSDKDRNTWNDFNIQLFAKKTFLQIKSYNNLDSNSGNIYIADVKELENSSDKIRSWKIDIARTSLNSPDNGLLVGDFSGKRIFSNNFRFEPSSYASSSIVSIEESVASMQEGSKRKLKITLVPTKEDLIKLDNTHFINMGRSKKKALLIGETQGEKFLEDPLKQLSVSFSVNGFQVKRADKMPQATLFDFTKFDTIVKQVGPYAFSGCSEFNLYRDTLNIWLVPLESDTSAQNTCKCIEGIFKTPLSCGDIFERSTLVKVLERERFIPIGGSAGDYLSAPFFKKDNIAGTVFVSTIPLDPKQGKYISHGRLPLLIKDLLKRQDRNTMSLGEENFTLQDITKALVNGTVLLEDSNVPKGESTLREVKAAQKLTESNSIEEVTAGVRYEKNPKNIIEIVVSLIVFLVGIELIYYVLVLLGKKRKNGKVAAGIFLAAIFSIGFSDTSYSYHNIHVLGGSSGGFDRLLKEVERRTSIDPDSKSEVNLTANSDLSKSYWLWAKNLNAVTSGGGKLNENIAFWIKKGGFLAIQGKYSKYQLDLLLKESFSLYSKKGSWKAISPDHELLRSFYLLDALPSCSNDVWYEYRYDGRLSILVIPDDFLGAVSQNMTGGKCKAYKDTEKLVRTFVNISMVALTTDYKKDQIHLPEILKRLR